MIVTTRQLRHVGRKLLPSWYSNSDYNELPTDSTTTSTTTTTSPAPSSTAYLSGMRGLASLLVFVHHYPRDYFPSWKAGFGATADHTSVFSLPFVRVVHSGSFMVGIFFVLSGYVLAHKALRQVRSGDQLGLMKTLTSSIFRRFVRLFLPIIPITLTVMLLQHWGIYGGSPLSIKMVQPDSIFVQLAQWWDDLLRIFNFYDMNEYGPTFGPQLWTLPSEFRGSMLVFLCILGLANAKVAVRISVMVFMVFATFYTVKSWDMALFLSGMLLAEIKMIQDSTSWTWEKLANDDGLATLARRLTKISWVFMLAAALFLGGLPEEQADVSTGYATIVSWTPDRFVHVSGIWPSGMFRFWTSAASVMLLASFDNLPTMQRLLNLPFFRYLGDISYALYLVHSPIVYTLGRYLTVTCTDLTGYTTVGFLMGSVVVVPLVFWAADIYWRYVDLKSVDFSKWLWMKCSIPAS